MGSAPAGARHDHLEPPGPRGAPPPVTDPAADPAVSEFRVLVLAKSRADRLGEIDIVDGAEVPVRIKVHGCLLRAHGEGAVDTASP